MALIGAILGDIAGSQWEFHRPKDLDWEHIELFTDKCKFTDDTVLSIATKYALVNKVPFSYAYQHFGHKYPNCGYGSAFYEWLNGDSCFVPYGSYGNGSAMRVSAVVDFCNSQNDVINAAITTALCTHNHPEGVKGAVVTAMCALLAKRGSPKPAIFEYASRQYSKEDYRYPVCMSLKELRECYVWDTSCQGSVPVAIRCFLESEDYESFIRNVLSLPCDTDTLCAIGGCIAEEYYHGTGFDEEKLLKQYLDTDLYQLVME